MSAPTEPGKKKPEATEVYPEATYAGRYRSFGYVLTVGISANAKRISAIGVQFGHGSCSDGCTYAIGLTRPKNDEASDLSEAPVPAISE